MKNKVEVMQPVLPNLFIEHCCYQNLSFSVSKIHKIGQGPPPPNGGPPQEALEPLTGSHLVELSVLAPSGSDAVADDMKNFAEQLKPLVQMDKIDPRRQGPM